MCCFGLLGHAGGEWADYAVTHQDAEEGADEGRGDLLADLFWRAAERAHGDDHAQDGGDDAEAGKRIGDGGQGLDGRQSLRGAATSMSSSIIWSMSKGSTPPVIAMRKRIADEGRGVMILEEAGIFLEYRAFGRLLDVVFNAHEALFADLVAELVHHLEGVEVTGLAELRASRGRRRRPRPWP